MLHLKCPAASKFLTVNIFGHVILTSQIQIKENKEEKGNVGLVPVSPKHHSTALLFILHGCAGRQHHCPGHICCKKRCLATAINAGFPFHHFPED